MLFLYSKRSMLNMAGFLRTLGSLFVQVDVMLLNIIKKCYQNLFSKELKWWVHMTQINLAEKGWPRWLGIIVFLTIHPQWMMSWIGTTFLRKMGMKKLPNYSLRISKSVLKMSKTKDDLLNQINDAVARKKKIAKTINRDKTISSWVSEFFT